MDKQRKIIFPDGREEIVRFVDLARSGAVGIPRLRYGLYDHYSLVTDYATYVLMIYKDRVGALLSDSELPLLILLKDNESCEFPELPDNGKPDCENWRFHCSRPHTVAEEMRLQREAAERDKTEAKAKDQEAGDKEIAKRARLAKLHGKLGGRPTTDSEKQITDAVQHVLSLLKNNRYLKMKRACEIAVKKYALTIHWEALQKHIKKVQRKLIIRKTRNVTN